jgi:hypothetical protein
MSVLALSMDVFLAVLLIAALVMGVRLNARLKALRQSHEGFARAIVELNDAAVRAERGLAGLREAATETHDSLLARIDTARSLATKLDGQIQTARGLIESQALTRSPPPSVVPSSLVQPAPSRAEAALAEPPAHDSLRRLALRFGLSRGDESVQSAPQRDAEPRPARPSRQRLPEEDDLFQPNETRPPARLPPTFSRLADSDNPQRSSVPSRPDRQTAEDFAAKIRARRTPGGTGR